MLNSRQLLILITLGIIFWALAADQIRWLAGSVAGVLPFLTSLPAGWISVWTTRRFGSLSHEQLPAGLLVVGGIAMMIDGAVLHWAPGFTPSPKSPYGWGPPGCCGGTVLRLCSAF